MEDREARSPKIGPPPVVLLSPLVVAYMSGVNTCARNPAGWGKLVAHRRNPRSPRRGYGGDPGIAAAAAGANRGAARGGCSPRSFLSAGAGALTFSKQQTQGSMVSYGARVMGASAPLQDLSGPVRVRHHVDARAFGQGRTVTGPGPIPPDRMMLLGRAEQIVRSAETIVNRLARDVRGAEDRKLFGAGRALRNDLAKSRPRLLRAGAAAEAAVFAAMRQLEGSGLDSGRGVEGGVDGQRRTEGDIVKLFQARLASALNKVTTLGLQQSDRELAGREQIMQAQAQSKYYPPPNHNMRNTAAGSYGRFDKPQLLVSPIARNNILMQGRAGGTAMRG